jgi:diguanylate cyclase (GGDEF)-like protein/PAS domain S-box-containing protein
VTADKADKKGSAQAERAVIEIVKEVLAGSAQLPDGAPRVLEVVCEHLGWDVGVMSVVDAGTNSLHRVGSWARGETGEVPTASSAALSGYLGSISFPIRQEHEVLGTIELYSKDAKRPDDTLISTLEMVGAEVAEFVHRKEADDDPDTAGGKYRTIVEGMPAVSYTAVADEGMRTLYVSPQIKQMIGISPTEWRNDPTLRSKSLFASDRDRVLADYRRARQSGEPVHLEYRMQARDGATVWVRESVLVPRDSSGKATVMQGLIVDITSQRQGEQNDAYRAYHDELTGLPNRPMFEEFLEQVLLRAGGHNLAVAALNLNLDDFQMVNSSLGHDGGDELLQQVAVRLRDAAQEANLVARQEGDEFLLLLAGRERSGGSLRASADDALLVAEAEASRIQEALQSPFMVAGNEFYVTASIGISIFPLDAENGETMLEHAHTAMRKSKKTGPGGYVLFSKDADDPVRGLSFTTKLRKAVERKDWVLHYHPIVDLESWDLVGVEALLRWRDSNGELVPPGEFILAAEDMGLIEAVGDWVVDEICRQSRTWREDGLELDISINLSPRQLWQPNLVERISSSLRASRVDPETIVIEVPETAAMADPDRTRRVLEQFREEGLKIAIDDFGKALSSIRRLKDLPVDILKVDQSFVRKLPDDDDASTMARAIIQLAHSLGMVALAEGIDSEAQREFLVGETCPLGQGYLFAKPMAAEDVAGWESQDHYVDDEEEEQDEEEEPTNEEREESVRALRERIGGHAGEDRDAGNDRDDRDGREGRGPGGRSGGDDEKPWAVAHAGDGSEPSARSTQSGIAVAERPWGMVPPADEDVPSMIGGRSSDEDDRPYEAEDEDGPEDPASRRRRHGGPSLGH